MIDRILRDSELHPSRFFWWGRLSFSAIEDWERQNALRAPADLKLLWSVKGGGDLFDSESILQPFGAAEYDLIEPATRVYYERGLSTDFCVFQKGLVESLFRKADGAIFSLRSSSDLSQMVEFRDLDEWYEKTLRPVFAKQYGLDPSE